MMLPVQLPGDAAHQIDRSTLKDCDQDKSDGICHIKTESAVDKLSKRLLLEDAEIGAEDGNLDDW